MHFSTAIQQSCTHVQGSCFFPVNKDEEEKEELEEEENKKEEENEEEEERTRTTRSQLQ